VLGVVAAVAVAQAPFNVLLLRAQDCACSGHGSAREGLQYA
jgi:hypothetical protein